MQLKSGLREPLRPDQFHAAVFDMVQSYHRNYELLFPDLNYVPMLVQTARMLALPSIFHPKSIITSTS